MQKPDFPAVLLLSLSLLLACLLCACTDTADNPEQAGATKPLQADTAQGGASTSSGGTVHGPASAPTHTSDSATGATGELPSYCSYAAHSGPQELDTAIGLAIQLTLRAEGKPNLDRYRASLPDYAFPKNAPPTSDPRTLADWRAHLQQQGLNWRMELMSEQSRKQNTLLTPAFFRHFGIAEMAALKAPGQRRHQGYLIVWNRAVPLQAQPPILTAALFGYPGPLYKGGRFTLIAAPKQGAAAASTHPLDPRMLTAFKTFARCAASE